jgi:hypothetical protein
VTEVCCNADLNLYFDLPQKPKTNLNNHIEQLEDELNGAKSVPTITNMNNKAVVGLNQNNILLYDPIVLSPLMLLIRLKTLNIHLTEWQMMSMRRVR